MPPKPAAFSGAAQIFDASLGSPGFLCKVDLHAASVLRLQISIPLIFVPEVFQPRQKAGINQIIAVAQQADDCTTPDLLDGVLLKEDIAPDAVFHVESTASDGQVNVRMLVELASIGVQAQRILTSTPCLRAQHNMARVAARQRVLSRG